jgi:uncharacterized membrane protein
MAAEQAVVTPEYAKWLSQFGGRKFVLVMVAMLIITVMRFTGFLDQGTFQILFMATVGVYVAGNVTQKATAKTQKVAVAESPAKAFVGQTGVGG